jgi:hypothetical protein
MKRCIAASSGNCREKLKPPAVVGSINSLFPCLGEETQGSSAP